MSAVKTTVVNCRLAPYDVYIGRAGHGHDGYHGNPYVARTRGRAETKELFEAYFFKRLKQDLIFRQRTLALHGKRIGCFCKDALGHGPWCHGDTIAAWVDAEVERRRAARETQESNRLAP